MERGNTAKIRVDQVAFSYQSENILDGINLEIAEGDFVCILGSSGCGKSTLLSLLEGLNYPDKGSVTIDGEPIRKPGLDRSVVFQDYSLFPWMSTGKNILLALKQRFPKIPDRELKERVNHYFRLVELDGVYDKLPGELSGGMRQRAAIARAFSLEAPVMLMDEPFGALDAITRNTLQDLLTELCRKERNTIVFVTHDVDEALFMANRIIILGEGKVKMDILVGNKNTVIKELYLRDETVVKLKEQILRCLNETEQEKTIPYYI